MVGLYNPQDMKEYYELCRGKNCLEMTKWFNTNYHYLVPEIKNDCEFKLNWLGNYAKWYQKPIHLIGPYTFLKLSKGSFNLVLKSNEPFDNFKKVYGPIKCIGF